MRELIRKIVAWIAQSDTQRKAWVLACEFSLLRSYLIVGCQGDSLSLFSDYNCPNSSKITIKSKQQQLHTCTDKRNLLPTQGPCPCRWDPCPVCYMEGVYSKSLWTRVDLLRVKSFSPVSNLQTLQLFLTPLCSTNTLNQQVWIFPFHGIPKASVPFCQSFWHALSHTLSPRSPSRPSPGSTNAGQIFPKHS